MALFLHSSNVPNGLFSMVINGFSFVVVALFQQKRERNKHAQARCCHFCNYKLNGCYFHQFRMTNKKETRTNWKKEAQNNEIQRKRSMVWQIKIKLNWPRKNLLKSKIKCKELSKRNYRRKLFQRFGVGLWNFCGIFFFSFFVIATM